MQQKTHIQKGLVIAAILIIFKAITHFTHTVFAEWTVFIFGLIILLGVLISVVLHKNENNSIGKFTELFSYGFKVTAVVTCIYFIFIFLETKLFFPNYIHEKFYLRIENMQNNFKIESLNLNNNLVDAIDKETKIYFAGTIMSILFLGVLGAILGSVISKTKARN